VKAGIAHSICGENVRVAGKTVSSLVKIYSLWGPLYLTTICCIYDSEQACLQCFDAVGWATGKGSGL